MKSFIQSSLYQGSKTVEAEPVTILPIVTKIIYPYRLTKNNVKLLTDNFPSYAIGNDKQCKGLNKEQ
ncbi:hypothetical protein BpHYR1_032998 [Brachionus plicatilis]|uniref:Uncharacterized protein n=1 Tax=Brachionus plicatilis TaxID=10195 RepID=A0A3M7R8K7_BRAPC|nr:hypothetical protein BpHYR1_032998 [Brachionus plicatilis]